MTTHHNIHLVKTKTDLKLTYRDGKFKKIEHLRGAVDASILKHIGIVIPPKESDLNAFMKAMEGRALYTSEQKIVSLFSKFNTVWFAFFRKENNNIDPKFTGADGKALNQIITYLKNINTGDEAAALANWQLLLDNWSSLSEFHQKQTDLKYINSKLNVIIREIIHNNGGNTSGTNGSVSI
ncbi:hypothetical protein MC378_10325 [Polaribacter sp. MSW13]|uniref:Uncharacterized protein n=1 Tax=Polaribacter marinus TaxID=2916838 RepID=A0A9X1VNZ0_9FLAO|nr:hypothetical protein [Polaribacter marinus]MCI2229563.1 hypothetical protein [Polaribacter marinus]